MNDRARPSHSTRFVAGWQRCLLWLIWIGLCLFVWNNSRWGKVGWIDVGILLAAIATTVACCRRPLGMPKVVIRDPSEMSGEFASRASFLWLSISVFLCLGGVAMSAKLMRDLQVGATTIRGAVVDVVDFYTEWLFEFIIKGRRGDVTSTHLYILVGFLPIGLAMLWYNLLPLLYRGHAFRISSDGTLDVKGRGGVGSLECEGLFHRQCRRIQHRLCESRQFANAGLATAMAGLLADGPHPRRAHVIAGFFRKQLEIERLSGAGPQTNAKSRNGVDRHVRGLKAHRYTQVGPVFSPVYGTCRGAV